MVGLRRRWFLGAPAVAALAVASDAAADSCPAPPQSYGRTFALFSHRALSVPSPSLLAIGDSRTAQLNWQFLGKQKLSVVNMGISGATVRSYRNFLYNEQVNGDLGKPTAALVNLGINDVWTPGESEDWRNFDENYSAILKWLTERNMKVIVCTPAPLESGYPKMSALERAGRFKEICARIENVAERASLPVLDYSAALRKEDYTAIAGSTLEGIHLSARAVSVQLELTESFVSDNLS